MKRFFAFLLALVLLSGVFACAETPNLPTMSDGELLSLYEAVRTELARRGLSAMRSLPEGKYIIGEDLLPGTYTITCTATEGDDLGTAYSSLGDAYGSLLGDEWSGIFNSLGGAMGALSGASVKVLGDYGTVLKEIELKTGEKATLTLAAGTALEITDGSVTLEAE